MFFFYFSQRKKNKIRKFEIEFESELKIHPISKEKKKY